MDTNSNKEDLKNIMGDADETTSDQQFTVDVDSHSSSTVDIANNTFRELCKTLEYEQIKLRELEARRRALQDEVDLLKKDIEEEKQLYNKSLEEFNIIPDRAPKDGTGDAAVPSGGECLSGKVPDQIHAEVSSALGLQVSGTNENNFMISSTELAKPEVFHDEIE